MNTDFHGKDGHGQERMNTDFHGKDGHGQERMNTDFHGKGFFWACSLKLLPCRYLSQQT